MRFASLGSGSRGNALVVEAGKTRLLVDCGYGPRQLAQRLARLGLSPEDLAAIVVTHEHSDHASGVRACARRYGLPVVLTHGTLCEVVLQGVTVEVIDSHSVFAVHDLELRPFPVPHDAREPVQFIFSDGSRRLGLLTDVGCATEHICEVLSGCHALLLECNHDAQMLASGPYPPGLKQRISGRWGHLDNASAAALLGRLDRRYLQHVVAAHLSQENNTPTLARAALSVALNCQPEWVGAADQETGFGWREIL
jgi:phosphoribosyl 1,2-cyclic phosphodiesterase